MNKFDPVALTFIAELVKTKATLLETASRLADNTDSNLYRAEILNMITSSCKHIDLMLSFNNGAEEVE